MMSESENGSTDSSSMQNSSTPQPPVARSGNSQKGAPWPYLIVFFWALVALAAGVWRKLDSGDVLFHLKAGQSILRTGQIPTRDIFSATSSVGIWVYFEWLWAMILAYAYQLREWTGVNTLGTIT